MSRSPDSTSSPPGYPREQLDLLGEAAMQPDPALQDSPTHAALSHVPTLLALLAQWTEQGWLRALDLVFCRFLHQQAPQAQPCVLLAAALASYQLGRGHVCLDLQHAASQTGYASQPSRQALDARPAPACTPLELLAMLALPGWKQDLQNCSLVETGAGQAPLVLQDNRLYLRRYWQYEQDVLQAVQHRLAQGEVLRQATPVAWIAEGLRSLFGPQPDELDWQRAACALMSCCAFGVITGGPGTGKTTTVLRLLALLQSLSMRHSQTEPVPKMQPQALRICLAAPTGKAAARLQESISGALHRLDLSGFADADQIRRSIPSTVTTLHRLLGSRPDSRRMRHDARNPLALDVLVIDEASMIDLEMMAAVLAALPAQARLLLLGDKDQLSSVEAGAVLGSLCARAGAGHYRDDTAEWLVRAGAGQLPAALRDPQGLPLDQAVAMLRHSYRFGAESGIGRMAQTVNQGDAHALRNLLRSRTHDLAVLALSPADDQALARLVIDGSGQSDTEDGRVGGGGSTRRGYRHYLQRLRQTQPALDAPRAAYDDWARTVLQAYGEFQVLCALRQGHYGVEGLNSRIAHWLAEAGLIARDGSPWYLGRPVLVTRNDYGLGLMNGDVGITLALPHVQQDAALDWTIRVAFAASDGSGIRWVLPSRLQAVETVYAMTVHKSQGSEFSHAALVLPERGSPVLTRELIYTGITRARQFFTLAGAAQARGLGGLGQIEQAVGRTVQRSGGLKQGWGA